MNEEVPVNHESQLCYHCGKDFRLHTRGEQFDHAMQEPLWRRNRDNIISNGLKKGHTMVQLHKDLGGVIYQSDMRRMTGHDVSDTNELN